MEDLRSLSLSLPLLPPTNSGTAVTSQNQSVFLSNQAIAVRLLLVAFIGITSLWANHEASKGFEITILNHADKSSPAGQRFDLFYVSNDEATRLLLNASAFIENLLYPSQAFPKKPLKSLRLTFSRRDLPSNVSVQKLDGGVDFDVNLSPSIFNQRDVKRAMSAAVFRGMARVWLWDGVDDDAPSSLLAGMVEHIIAAAGFVEKKYSGGVVSTLAACDPMWWKDKDPMEVAQFLDYYEGQRKGFIQRLNQGLKSRWQDRTVKYALGMPGQHPCGSFNSSQN